MSILRHTIKINREYYDADEHSTNSLGDDYFYEGCDKRVNDSNFSENYYDSSLDFKVDINNPKFKFLSFSSFILPKYSDQKCKSKFSLLIYMD
jgi:hypothetical protein